MLRRALFTALTAMFVVSCAAEPEPVGPQAAEPQAPEWQVQIDESQNAADPDDTPDIEFTSMGAGGFQYVGGPAGTLWMPAQTASGDYTLSATFTQNEPAGHTNYYGLVFGGSDLGEAGAYTHLRAHETREELVCRLLLEKKKRKQPH